MTLSLGRGLVIEGWLSLQEYKIITYIATDMMQRRQILPPFKFYQQQEEPSEKVSCPN